MDLVTVDSAYCLNVGSQGIWFGGHRQATGGNGGEGSERLRSEYLLVKQKCAFYEQGSD